VSLARFRHGAQGAPRPLVIFLDEIDSLRDYKMASAA
jgi:hypothetical protein